MTQERGELNASTCVLTWLHSLFNFNSFAVPFLSLQIPITTGNRKVHNNAMKSSIQHGKLPSNAMKAYQKQRQYIYRHCQLGHVTPSYALIVGVCVLMLPMLELATEHAQPVNHLYHVHACHMTISHKPLVLPSLNNVLPSIAFENRIAWSNISYQSTHSRVCHVTLSPVSTVPTGLARRVVGVVVLLLLLMSGDIETNPGPVGECSSLMHIAI